MEEPYVHKIFTGKIKKLGNPKATEKIDLPWETGLFKTATEDQIWLGKSGLIGDEGNNNVLDKAVLAYPIKHYTYWQQKLGRKTITEGDMGENLSVLEMDEFTVCIGDVFQFGDAIIQVSQPKQPTWQLARKMRELDFALQMQNSGRTGWYFRVLQEGDVLSRIDVELIERPYPQWSIASCNEVMHVYKDDLRLTDDLASCELLSQEWRKILNSRLRGREPSIENRVYGPNI